MKLELARCSLVYLCDNHAAPVWHCLAFLQRLDPPVGRLFVREAGLPRMALRMPFSPASAASSLSSCLTLHRLRAAWAPRP